MDEDYTDEQIRDWYAGQALMGWAAGRNNGESSWNRSEGGAPSFVAESCYLYADAMMAEREKRKEWQPVKMNTEPPINPS